MKKIFVFYLFSALALIVTLLTGDLLAGVVLASAGVAWPMGEADVQTPAYSATLAVTITDQLTFLTPGTMTGAMTINLTVTSTVRKGAMIVLRATSDGTARTITFGTGFTSNTLAGTISKTNQQLFVYDGSTFIPVGAAILIN